MAQMQTRPAEDPTDRYRNRRGRGRMVAVLAVVAVAAATGWGCSGSSDSDAMSGEAAEPSAQATSDDGASSAEDAAAPGAQAVATEGVTTEGVVPALAAGRRQTFTASMSVEVEQVGDAVADAGRAVEGLGGFAANEEVDLGHGSSATITYRVPAEQFRAALGALAGVGDLQHQEVQATDVTATYADLEGRVTTLRTSVARIQGFLAEATDVTQITQLEGELTRREGELESVEAQRRALADRIELSTITVTFDVAPEAPAEPGDDRTLPTFLGGLERGWDALVAGGSVVLAGLGLVLPFVPLVAIAALALRWWARRRHPEPQAA